MNTPYLDQKFGTAGLRKKVSVFQQPGYLENLLEAIFTEFPGLAGGTLVIGGDGRYHNDVAIQTALAMAAAHGVAHALVGTGGICSTPATSHLIRTHHATAGLMFSASHNPAGPDGDFGVKLNMGSGGQASEALSDQIYQRTKTITQYQKVDARPVNLAVPGEQAVGGMRVTVVDGTEDYAALMRKLFDFAAMRAWLQHNPICFDALHAVTGPYAQRILVKELGAPASSVQNAVPLADFGGGHPDPNLVYCAHLWELAQTPNAPALIAASDGDGDRNMILGPDLFVSPGDSLAMLAAHLHLCPGYADGLPGVARSMPTSRAVDAVAAAKGIPCFETPTGWKFFCNLLDADRIRLCGEESFGTSSHHTREKDGLWAVLAWINVLAATGKTLPELALAHWRQFGRHFYQRHDYEDLPQAQAQAALAHLKAQLSALPGQSCLGMTVTAADDFAYVDPIDGSTSKGQGLRVVFGDSARLVFRLSGTGTGGATLRMYLEQWEPGDGNLLADATKKLAPLGALGRELLNLKALTGRDAPDLMT